MTSSSRMQPVHREKTLLLLLAILAASLIPAKAAEDTARDGSARILPAVAGASRSRLRGRDARPIVAGTTAMQACSNPESHQFDFWVGDWDVFEVENPATSVARVRVDRGGCVLREDYQDKEGHMGQSFSIYDAPRRNWHQSWVTNRGQLLLLDGGLQDGAIVLSAFEHTADGSDRQVRGTWKAVAGGVRETAVRSTDGGSTWTPWFDLMFRPHADSNSEDQKTVAMLDTQYQAAVKANDAATMDRILADDFVLVTGSGKKYTKADLLQDARSGSSVYEHEEDTEQTVRVWGDTAVVTAKLWEKGTDKGKPFDHWVWFSDTYVRTSEGWKYVFGQSSLPLPAASH
jgi:ketosteroid isomerase-like protein